MIKISLPNPNDYEGKGLRQFLRQFELSLHHIQKAFDELEKDGMITDETYITFRFPKIGSFYDYKDDSEGMIKFHVDDETNKFQSIEVEIGN